MVARKRKAKAAPRKEPPRKKPPGGGVGRMAYEPTDAIRANVEAMAAVGITHIDIAAVIGIDTKTLRKYYHDQLALGAIKANAAVGQSLYHQAVGRPARHDVAGNVVRAEQAPNVTAGIWWSKVRMGWKDSSRVEMTGKDGGPLEVLQGMDATELAKAAAALRAEIAARVDGTGADQEGDGTAGDGDGPGE